MKNVSNLDKCNAIKNNSNMIIMVIMLLVIIISRRRRKEKSQEEEFASSLEIAERDVGVLQGEHDKL